MRALLDEFDAAIIHAPRFDLLVLALEPEMDNLRAALRWAMGRPAARETALALLASSNALWSRTRSLRRRDPSTTGRRGLARRRSTSGTGRAFCMAYTAMARLRLLHPSQWRDEAWRALQVYRGLDDPAGLYKALCSLGSAPRDVVDEAQAGALPRRSRAD